MAIGSFTSGQLLANYGWSAMNVVVYPPVALGLVVLALTFLAGRRSRARLNDGEEYPEPSI
jgi:predicted MFS family arabinose efflux permease